MLWVGSAEARTRILHIDSQPSGTDETDDSAIVTTAAKTTPYRDRQAYASMGAEDFHAYQLITHALLHGGILHWAGNMLFLLVFGLRVNELIGDLKFSIVYPVLAIAAGLSYMLASSHQPLHPCLGASGAIMGLAGMYFVFFPVQHIHVAFWARLGMLTGFRLSYKVFRMRGFWLLLLWVGFNDLLPMLLGGGSDGVAHWAHLGGFLSGAAIAIGLLIARLASARGADLMSVVLGRHVWPLLGKPNQFLEAPIATTSANRNRVIVPARFA
jgi:membrane associated rhomboid family serine protease